MKKIKFNIPKYITDSPFGKFMFPSHLGQPYLLIDDNGNPFRKYQFNYEWGSTALYTELMKQHNKDKKNRSEFDIEFNGYFYEYSDMGDLIKCYLIDKMINQHVS